MRICSHRTRVSHPSDLPMKYDANKVQYTQLDHFSIDATRAELAPLLVSRGVASEVAKQIAIVAQDSIWASDKQLSFQFQSGEASLRYYKVELKRKGQDGIRCDVAFAEGSMKVEAKSLQITEKKNKNIFGHCTTKRWEKRLDRGLTQFELTTILDVLSKSILEKFPQLEI